MFVFAIISMCIFLYLLVFFKEVAYTVLTLSLPLTVSQRSHHFYGGTELCYKDELKCIQPVLHWKAFRFFQFLLLQIKLQQITLCRCCMPVSVKAYLQERVLEVTLLGYKVNSFILLNIASSPPWDCNMLLAKSACFLRASYHQTCRFLLIWYVNMHMFFGLVITFLVIGDWAYFHPFKGFSWSFFFSVSIFRSSLSIGEISLLSVIHDATLYSQFVLCLLMMFIMFFCHKKVLFKFF